MVITFGHILRYCVRYKSTYYYCYYYKLCHQYLTLLAKCQEGH